MLSLQQEHRLLFELAVPKCGSFNARVGLVLRGALRIDVLSEFLNQFIADHDVFRTAIHRTGATPNNDTIRKIYAFAESGLFEQTLIPAPACEPITLHAQDIGAERMEESLLRDYASEVDRKFDYARPPLLRAVLFRSGNGEHALLLELPHLICDAISIQMLRQRLEHRYNNPDHCVPECKTQANQYSEFVRLQRERLTSGVLDSALDYWRNKWALYSDAQMKVADLPFTKPAHRTHSELAGQETLHIDSISSKAIITFARQKKVTLYVLLRTAFHILLTSYSTRGVTAFWGNFANRMRPESDNAFGWVSNRHLLGADLSGNPTVTGALGTVRSSVFAELSRQEIPFPALEMLLLREGCRVHPRSPDELFLRFDVASAASPSEVVGSMVSDLGLPSTTCEGINLLVIACRETLTLEATFNLDRFAATDIRHMLTSFLATLAQMINGPDERVSRLAVTLGLQHTEAL